MIEKIPGTAMDFSPMAERNAFALISPILKATGGITLSQLSTLTGLEGSTIQNWTKRGWVASTIGKKYNEKQVVRILLMNILRGVMKLDDIARLMTYINGDVEDVNDDIIPDIELYNLFCRFISNTNKEGISQRDAIEQYIEKNLDERYNGTSRKKLSEVLLIMILGYNSAILKSQTEKEFSHINLEK